MAAHWLPLVILVTAFAVASAGTVNTTSQQTVEGSTVAVTCSYTVDENEEFEYVSIHTYIRNRGFVDVAQFWANGTTEYFPFAEPMRNRTSLIFREDSVALQFHDVRCYDTGAYYCILRTNESSSYQWMILAVSGPDSKPSIMLLRHSGCYDDGEDVEATCVGLVKRVTTKFQWHGFRADNTSIALSHLADPGVPYRQFLECGFKRVSHIKFNISEADDGMILRCFIGDEEGGVMPSVDDECGDSCAEVDNIHIRRHPQKPILANFLKSTCPGGKIQAACYGETGGPTGYYKWYKHKAGQDPVDITNSSDPGSPYQLHGSCQYERASMITLTASASDNGMVLRCVLRNHEADVSDTPTDECGDYCAESEKIIVRASCATPPKSKLAPVSAGTSLTPTILAILLTSTLLLASKYGID